MNATSNGHASTADERLRKVLNALKGVKSCKGGHTALCPAHEDGRSSLSVSIGREGRILLRCHAGCNFDAIIRALGIGNDDIFEPGEKKWKIVAEYGYVDESGKLLYQVVRLDPKDFRQRQPIANGWKWSIAGVRRVPFNLFAILSRPDDVIFVVEGEKDCLTLNGYGLLATTNAGGAGKFGTLDAETIRKAFAGRDVFVIPDNDEPGRRHADDVGRRLGDIAKSIRIVNLPGLPEKGDVSDWLTAGHTRDELLDLADTTPEWKPDERQESTAGETTAEKPNEPKAESATFQLNFISPAEFSAKVYKREWDIKPLSVRGQSSVWGGPRKGLKTSIAIDAAISMGTGTRFLGEFETTKRRVGIISGESGEATIQETFRRICDAKQVDFADCGVHVGFKLPQFTNIEHMAEVRRAIADLGLEVLFYDPLYLGLLSGVGGEGLQASNLYQIGPLLIGFAQACLEAGCTPHLLHHFKITRGDPYGEPQLDDLAFAGIQEFARQWTLLGRREKYQPGTGSHRLWQSVGGSCGHGGLWAVDIDEGEMKPDFGCREWRVSVVAGDEARQEKRDEKETAKRDKLAQQDRDDDSAVMAALDKLGSKGAAIEHIRVQARLSDARMARALSRLRAEGLIVELPVIVEKGQGAKVPAKGMRRKGENEQASGSD